MEDWLGITMYVAIIAALVWFFYIRNKEMENKNGSKPKTANTSHGIGGFYPITSPPPTRTLLLSVLRKLDMDYEFDEDKDLFITYHGEHFQILARDDVQSIQIRDIWWYAAPLDDIENLSIVHRAINDCNMYGNDVLVYSINKEDNTINLHTLRSVLWIPEIPNIEDYFIEVLNHMLHTHHSFFCAMEEIRREQHITT